MPPRKEPGNVVPTEIGNIGGLICWENYMPLARTALYTRGVELYLAPTADARESWQATIQHIALEGRCFVPSCNQFVTKTDYPDELDRASSRELADAPDPLCRGGSAVVGPLGEYVAGPLWDETGILYAHIDPGAITEARFDFDAVGHYSRPDLFHTVRQPDRRGRLPDLGRGRNARRPDLRRPGLRIPGSHGGRPRALPRATGRRPVLPDIPGGVHREEAQLATG